MYSRRPIALAILTCAAALFASAGQASRGWMQDGDIRNELVGIKLAGIYPGGIDWTEYIGADGSTDYVERGEQRRGTWNVAGELFCFQYAVLMQGGCFRVVKHGPNCYELYTASIGGTVPSEPPSYDSMSWNGRMWRETEKSSCEDKITS